MRNTLDSLSSCRLYQRCGFWRLLFGGLRFFPRHGAKRKTGCELHRPDECFSRLAVSMRGNSFEAFPRPVTGQDGQGRPDENRERLTRGERRRENARRRRLRAHNDCFHPVTPIRPARFPASVLLFFMGKEERKLQNPTRKGLFTTSSCRQAGSSRSRAKSDSRGKVPTNQGFVCITS